MLQWEELAQGNPPSKAENVSQRGENLEAEVTSGQGRSHLAGTTFVKKLQVHWGLL